MIRPLACLLLAVLFVVIGALAFDPAATLANTGKVVLALRWFAVIFCWIHAFFFSVGVLVTLGEYVRDEL